MKNTILVTGGAGYIGSHTVDALINSGFKVVIVDNLTTGFSELLHPEAKFYQVSLNETQKLTDIMTNENISGVMHFAAKIIVPDSIVHPLDYYENNTHGVISILKACQITNVKNFVFSSTAAVYGNASSDLVSENNPTLPINPYGFSKLFSEQIIRDTELEFGLKSVIFRYFNVAGASDSQRFGQRSKKASHLIKIACETACGKRSNMSITGTDYSTKDGTGIRDYIHVQDLAEAHVLAIKHLLDGGKSELFNCGYGHGYSVREVINCMKKLTHNFEVLEAPRREGDAASLVADSNKLRQMLNWIPKRDDLELICKSAYLFEKSL